MGISHRQSSADTSWGNGQNAEALFPALYGELRQLASAQLARLHSGGTLQPTALVHEAYLKLVGRPDAGWEERRHFFAAAAQAMRDIVIDHARRKGARKRGGGEQPASLEATRIDLAQPLQCNDDVLAINAAMTRLESEHPRKAKVAVLRYFGGLSVDEVAGVMGVTTRTIEREWRFARAYLHSVLAHSSTSGS